MGASLLDSARAAYVAAAALPSDPTDPTSLAATHTQAMRALVADVGVQVCVRMHNFAALAPHAGVWVCTAFLPSPHMRGCGYAYAQLCCPRPSPNTCMVRRFLIPSHNTAVAYIPKLECVHECMCVCVHVCLRV
jgi:hypothetical protein